MAGLELKTLQRTLQAEKGKTRPGRVGTIGGGNKSKHVENLRIESGPDVVT